MIKIKDISTEAVTTILTMNKEHVELVHNEISSTEDTIEGTIKMDKLEESIASYTITAPDKSRFKLEPTLSISTKDYTITSSTTSDDDGNIISKTFNIFKAL